MKIGIPKALMFYYYYPFWKCFFEELGHEVVTTDDTNINLITEGINATVSELCVPIKIFNGHVIELLKKDVDLVFIPQFYSMKSEWYCPKFIGITELAEFSVDNLKDRMLVVTITSKNDVIDKSSDYIKVADRLGVSAGQIKKALKKAKDVFNKFRDICKQGHTAAEAFDILDGKPVIRANEKTEIKIGLVGYVYNVYDKYVSLNAVERLREMNSEVVTFEMYDENQLLDENKGKAPFWVYSRKIYNAVKKMLNDDEIDGIIHLTAFACGPDSVIGKMIEVDCFEQSMPFMTLRIDEHTGESHLQTRLEAFTDMLKIKKHKK